MQERGRPSRPSPARKVPLSSCRFLQLSRPNFARDLDDVAQGVPRELLERLQRSGNFLVRQSKNLLSYADVDTTLSDFAEKLYSEYLKYFPYEENGVKYLIMSWQDVCWQQDEPFED